MVLKINKKKFEIFLEVAKELNSRLNVIPILFGSLGLYRRIGEFGKSNDVDVLVPSSLVNEKWSELIKLMQDLTFKLDDEKEHEFIRKKEIVAFGKQEDLVKNCKINSDSLEISSIKKVKFRQLLPEQYLLVYRFMLRDNYRQEKRGSIDKEKIILIEKYLRKCETESNFKYKIKNKLMKKQFYIWDGVFTIAKTKKTINEAFAVIQDKNEITVIIDELKIGENKIGIIEKESGYKIITFDMVLPFGLVGFLAEIAQALAEENISIFAVSAFSTDHVLVKENNLSKAIKKLREIGFCKK